MLMKLILIFSFCIYRAICSLATKPSIPEEIYDPLLPEDFKAFFDKIGPTSVSLSPEESIFAQGQGIWRESTLSGRFVTDFVFGTGAGEIDANFVEKCANYNYSFNNANESQRAKYRSAFLTKLKSLLEFEATSSASTTSSAKTTTTSAKPKTTGRTRPGKWCSRLT